MCGDDTDIDSYIDEVNSGVDAGGCMEVAEHASTIREESSADEGSTFKPDRRSFLSAAFGGTLASLGVGNFLKQARALSKEESKGNSNKSGVRVERTESRVDDVINSEAVSSIQGSIQVDIESDDALGYSIYVEELDLEIEATVVETSHGELAHLSDDKGRTESLLIFDAKSKVPTTKFGAPAGVQGALVAHPDKVEFIRPISQKERSEVAKKVGAIPKEVHGVAGTFTSGIEAYVPDDADKVLRRYEFGQDLSIRASGIVGSAPSGGEISPTDTCDGAFVFCYLCVQSAPICYLCAGLCYTGVGILACVLCLIHTCGVSIPDCYTCADCLS